MQLVEHGLRGNLLEHIMRRDTCSIDLQDILRDNEDLPPQSEEVGLDGTTGRTEIVQATDTSVNRERREEERSPLQQILEAVLVDLQLVRWVQLSVLDMARHDDGQGCLCEASNQTAKTKPPKKISSKYHEN
jgi:hypothetical protein